MNILPMSLNTNPVMTNPMTSKDFLVALPKMTKGDASLISSSGEQLNSLESDIKNQKELQSTQQKNEQLLQNTSVGKNTSFANGVPGGADTSSANETPKAQSPQKAANTSKTETKSNLPKYEDPLPEPISTTGVAKEGRELIDQYPAYKGRPQGKDAIEKMFGQPCKNQTTVTMPAGPGGEDIKVTCNKAIAERMTAAFQEIKDRGLSDNIESFDGCFLDRNKRGNDEDKSVHAYGIAFDLNAKDNPQTSTVKNQSEGQKQLAQVLAKYGFHQLPKDPMHFQFARGY